MKPFTVECEYSAHHRFEATVEAEDPIAACRAAIELANDSSDWRSHCGPTPSYVVALAPGVDVDPWRDTPEGADASVLPVPGLFTDTARVAGYAATRSEDLVLQLGIMLDAISDDGRSRLDPTALVRLCATGRAILKDIKAFGLPPKATRRGEGGAATAIASPGAGQAFRQRDAAHGPPRAVRNPENRAVLPLRGCPLHPGFRGSPRLCLGAAAPRSAAQEVRIRRVGRRHHQVKGSRT